MATVMEPDVDQQAAPTPGGARTRTSAATVTPAPGGRRRVVFMVLGAAFLALLGLGGKKWWWSRSHVSSDNAQVDGHIIPILPKVGGFVAEVRVDENHSVKAGDTLVVLDDRDFRVRLQQTEADLAAALASVNSRVRVGQAEAAVAQAQAQTQKAHADLDRIRPLAGQGIVSQQQLDAAQAAAAAGAAPRAAAPAALVGADARVASARASRDQAALNLAYTRITAPSDGVVSKKTVEVGQLVQPGQPLLSVVPLGDVWVTANLKETETTNVRQGQAVTFTVDAYPGCNFRGHVESLSPATGARFSLLPPDNATGNFTKVVQRIPVRLRPDGAPDCGPRVLRPGMSVVATITTR
jgi:membrane fusion protein (multidrug efflux system)